MGPHSIKYTLPLIYTVFLTSMLGDYCAHTSMKTPTHSKFLVNCNFCLLSSFQNMAQFSVLLPRH